MISCQYHGPAAACLVPAHRTEFQAAKQSNKRVRFQPSVTVQPIDCSMTPEEKLRSHYSKDELNAISLEVKTTRALSKELRGASSAGGAHAIKHDCLVRLEVDPAFRGLERYLYPIRVRNQVLAQKAVLKHHQTLNTNPNRTSEEKLFALAAVSAKMTRWSNQVAVETARLDSLRAYEEDYLIPISEPVGISPFPVTTKRRRVQPNMIIRDGDLISVNEPANTTPFIAATKRRRVTYDEDIQAEKRILYCTK